MDARASPDTPRDARSPTGAGGQEEAEAEILAEPESTAAADEPIPNGARADGGEPNDELPSPDEFAARIPPEVLATMDELFRAKWTAVKRLRPGDLKDAGPE